MVALDLAGSGIDRDSRSRVKIIARTLVTHPRATIAGAPKGQIGLRIVITGNPDGATAGLPLIALRPGFAARFSRRRHSVDSPHFLPGVRVVGGDEAAGSKFAAGCADQDLAVGDKRRQRHVITGLVVRDRGSPDFLAGPGVDGDEHRLAQGEKDLVAVECNTTRRLVRDQCALG